MAPGWSSRSGAAVTGVRAGRPGDDQSRRLLRALRRLPGGRGVALPDVPRPRRAPAGHRGGVRGRAGREPGAGAAPAMPWAAGGGLLAGDAHRVADARPTRAALRPGETVLVWGIGGGVAMAALQIARHARRPGHRDQRLRRQARRSPGGLGADVTAQSRARTTSSPRSGGRPAAAAPTWWWTAWASALAGLAPRACGAAAGS